MIERYQNKIKDVIALTQLLGSRPRNQKVVMCHGTFDVVHPGHLRHLLWAKAHGDVLVASLTADAHVEKGEGRPYVPEDLRATSLSVLEMVDFVVIDRNPEPIQNIGELQPDFFVKGFEYGTDGVHPKTKKEMEEVAKYGGEFLFSPGDIVYSSTKLLGIHQPAIAIDKLATLMQAEGVTFSMLRETLDALAGTPVHIVGDTIVDKYSYCSLLGATTKTPTFSVKLQETKTFVGGAGIVAKHLQSLGADVTFSTVLGDDELGAFVLEDIKNAGIRINAIIDEARPTTSKQRFWANNYKLLQVDELENSPIANNHVEQLRKTIQDTPAELVVFSDFRHGLFHSDSIGKLTSAIPDGAITAADSQVSNRWGNILEFEGFDLITPNEHEARFALADQDSVVRHLAQKLLQESKARNLILKLGERGILTYRRDSELPRSFFHLDSFAENLVDGVGAGDALLAAASVAISRSGDIVQSAILGNLAAAAACEREGNQPVTQEGIRRKLGSLESALNAVGNV